MTEAQKLLTEIEAFLEETGIGPTYLGKASVNNSDLVENLRKGGDCLTGTVQKVREFMKKQRASRAMATSRQ